MIHYMVSPRLCFVLFFGGYVESPKLHEGLTHLFTKTENVTKSTREIVAPSSQIDDIPHCTTMYKMYMYLRGGSRHFHKGDPFYFRNYFFIEISKNTET